jgi:hypothetical protein
LTLEFKRELPQPRLEQAKVELLKDVCAMANSAGGDILYGMEERDGAAAALVPITEPFDAAERRMRQVLDAIEPRLDGLRFREVTLGSGGYAMVLRVPASYAGPHRFASRFVLRDGTRNTDMTYDQLRAAFDRTATLAARAISFRDERVARIERGDGFRDVEAGPLMVVHVLPMEGMSGRKVANLALLYNSFATMITNSRWGGASRAYNLDGITIFPARNRDGHQGYVQAFRNGTLEFVELIGREYEGQKWIASANLAEWFRNALPLAAHASRLTGVAGPAIVSLGLVGAKGYTMALPQGFMWHGRAAAADRERMVVPEVWVDDVTSLPPVDEIARPMLDVLWQGFQMERCLTYRDDGSLNLS